MTREGPGGQGGREGGREKMGGDGSRPGNRALRSVAQPGFLLKSTNRFSSEAPDRPPIHLDSTFFFAENNHSSASSSWNVG